MRKEYDLSEGERGKFYGRVDTKNPIIEDDKKNITEILENAEFFESGVHKNKCSN